MTLRDLWWIVTLGCISWYLIVTVFAAWRGGKEVLQLVRLLRDRPEVDAGASSDVPNPSPTE